MDAKEIESSTEASTSSKIIEASDSDDDVVYNTEVTNKRQTSQKFTRLAGRSRILQNFLLVWLDGTIDETDDDFRDSLKQLRHVVACVHIFIDPDECIKFLRTIENERIFVIVPGYYGQQFISDMYKDDHIDSIYVFCRNEQLHKQWAKDWPKIKGVHTSIDEICDALRTDRAQCDRDSIPMTFSGIDPTFMYTQLLKEIILEMDDENEEEALKTLIIYCKKNAQILQEELRDFESEYDKHTSICWYTRECFIYPTLNKALRELDVATILPFGFFIRKLHCQLKAIHHEQATEMKIFTVYRGQGLALAQFHKLQNSVNGYISFNSFLSTSRSRKVSLGFAWKAKLGSNNVAILFTMTINPALCESTPFADIDNYSYYKKEEEEILFSTHTIFRVKAVTTSKINEEKGIWYAELVLVDPNCNELTDLTSSTRQQLEGLEDLDRLGRILINSGNSGKALSLYEELLARASDDDDKALYNYQLGWIYHDIGEHSEAIKFYKEALNISEKSLRPNNHSVSATLNNIALVYSDLGEYTKALKFYKKAYDIYEKCLPSTHPSLAISLSNIGGVYSHMGEYSEALKCYEKAHEIKEKALPSTHPALATSFNNFGGVHSHMGKYLEALKFYEKAHKIYERSLPPTHIDLAISLSNIGRAHSDLGEYSKALEFHEKARDIYEKSLSSTHPSVAASLSNIGRVYSDLGKYSKALEFHEEARNIYEKSLPPTHPSVAASLSNLGRAHSDLGEYLKALEFHEKAHVIYEKSLPPTHPSVAASVNSIGRTHSDLGEYSKALEFHEKAREIYEKSLPPTHPALANCFSYIGVVYSSMRHYSKALEFYEKELAIREKSVASDHPFLALAYARISTVHRRCENYADALEYNEKTLKILEICFDSEHPHLGTLYCNIGRVHSDMGKYTDALKCFKKALEIRKKRLPPKHPELATVYKNIGWVHRQEMHYAKALKYYEMAMEIWHDSLPETHLRIKGLRDAILFVKEHA